LKFWAGIYSIEYSSQDFMDLLKMVGLKTFALEKAGNFSRGMSQRLSLSRVLMLSPLLMLLDEPGTGLDTDSRKLLRENITRSSRNGSAVVWVSHTLEEDLELSDEVIFLENKKVSFYGTTRDFKSHSQEKSVEN
ncbi:MAG: ATP-binding cassette domain-containing protein, partial [Desulfovibrionales bacterium]|nr:ATP-binding cassette domain-containing protein [Desulfovibrionales bacterium]